MKLVKQSRDVLAGAYRGARRSLASTYTHLVFLPEGDLSEGDAFCGRVKNLAGGGASDPTLPPTCPVCLARWNKDVQGARVTPLELEDARRTAPTPERCGSLFFQHTEADRTLLRKHDHFLWRLRVLLGEGPLSVTDLAEKYGIKVTTLRKKLRIAKAFGYVTVENSQVTYREVRK